MGPDATRPRYLITTHRPLLASVAVIAVILWICFAWAVVRDTEPPNAYLPVAPAAHSAAHSDPKILRVCADPDNLPYANARGEGFDNAIAELLAREIGRSVEYAWQPRGRGDVRATISTRVCDVLMNVPTSTERIRTTRPYYRSTYVFVTRRDLGLTLRSFDDPRLRNLRIGIQLAADDNPDSPRGRAARQLAARLAEPRIYSSESSRGARRHVVDALARRDVDVAILWGPLAGHFAARERTALTITPVHGRQGAELVPFAFDISVGVRQEDAPLHAALDAAIARRASDIHAILRRYGVPLVTGT